MHRYTSHHQTGVALITVLLIVFLASMIATSLATLQQIAIRRSAVLLHQQQARLFTLGAEQWAMLLLARDREQSTTDHPNEEWASSSLAFSLDQGSITLRLQDLQGCFNLNNLWKPASDKASPNLNDPKKDKNQKAEEEEESEATESQDETDLSKEANPAESKKAGLNQEQLQVLERLLESLDLKPELAQAVADWIDPDSDTRFPDGAEDSDYTVRNPAYLAANRPFLSVSELRLVKGVDRETYNKLKPLVCALPPETPLNVNTASATVLAALGEGLDVADIEHVLETRPDTGYANVDELLDAVQLTVEAPIRALLSADSQYFLLQAESRVGDGRAMLYSTLFRDNNGVRVLQRSFGNQD